MSITFKQIDAVIEEELGDDIISLCEEYIHSGNVPGICTNCGTVYESGNEPDLANAYCDECNTRNRNSIFIVAGVI